MAARLVAIFFLLVFSSVYSNSEFSLESSESECMIALSSALNSSVTQRTSEAILMIKDATKTELLEVQSTQEQQNQLLQSLLGRMEHQEQEMAMQKLKNQEQDTVIQEQGTIILEQGTIIQKQAEEILRLKNGGIQTVMDEAEIQRLESLVEKLEDRQGAITAPTCHHWAMYGMNRNGEYMIDPDGDFYGEPPFLVYCDFTTNSTLILHSPEEMTSVHKCEEFGCSRHDVEYQATETQIENLKSLSQSCTQSIEFGCHLAPLRFEDENHGWWLDRLGNPQYFLQNTDYNCNSKLPTWLSDNEIIDAKDILPIKSFHYGPLTYSLEAANVTIGRLSCKGLKDSNLILTLPALRKDIMENRENIEANKQNADEFNRKLERTQASDENNRQKIETNQADIQRNQIKTTSLENQFRDRTKRVIFASEKTSDGDFNGWIRFDRTYINVGNGMRGTSGTFRAPEDGYYVFGFKGATGRDSKYWTSVRVYLGNTYKFQITDGNQGDGWNNITGTWIWALRKGATVRLKVVEHKLSVVTNDYDKEKVLFWGFRISEL